MSTADQEEMYIAGPERDMDFAVFDGFDVSSFIKDHHGIPDVAKSSQTSVRDCLRAIQQQVIENDPGVQQILAGIVHERAQETKTPYADTMQKRMAKVRTELQQEFGNYDVRDNY